MAASGRYRLPSADEIKRILEEKDSKNTKRIIKGSVESFRNFLKSTGRHDAFERYDKSTLDCRLGEFFVGVQREDGNPLKSSSMHSMKYGLKKYIMENMDMDIDGHDFVSSSGLYKAVICDLKKRGYGKTDHHPPISEEDLKSLYSGKTPVFYLGSPCGLQQKVWFEIMYYLCRRGRENLRQMKKSSFQIATDDTGAKYVYQAVDEMDKNHRENSNGSNTEGRMYQILGNRNCPVLSYQLYISKLHHNCEDLWQKPKDSISTDGDDIWYCCAPLGKNTLSNFMPRISTIGKLSRKYTNHSVRATSITVMDQCGIDTRHIMKVSGHASESSIKSYSHSINDHKKREISNVLSDSLVKVCDKPPTVHQRSETVSGPPATENTGSCAQVNDSVDQELMDILALPFELEPADLKLTQPTNVQSTNILSTSSSLSKTSEMSAMNFTPKFENGCSVTININNYY